MFFVKVIFEGDGAFADKKEAGRAEDGVETLELKEDYKRWLVRQKDKRKRRGQPHCIRMEEEYILFKEREGRVPKGAGEEV